MRFQPPSPAPTITRVTIHENACLWPLTHPVTAARTGLSAPPVAVAWGLTEVVISPDSSFSHPWTRTSHGPSAPGATRTPGLRFRKPPLYPPELQGRNL